MSLVAGLIAAAFPRCKRRTTDSTATARTTDGLPTPRTTNSADQRTDKSPPIVTWLAAAQLPTRAATPRQRRPALLRSGPGGCICWPTSGSVETSDGRLVTRVALASVGAVKDAKSVLAAGGLVAFPTETVYGLGADATNDKAVAQALCRQGRPVLQSADRPRRRSRRRHALARIRRRRAAPRPRVLAGPADPGAAQGRRTARSAGAGDRRPRHHRRAGAEPSGRARNPGRVRQARRGAVGEPVRRRSRPPRRSTCLPTFAAAST